MATYTTLPVVAGYLSGLSPGGGGAALRCNGIAGLSGATISGEVWQDTPQDTVLSQCTTSGVNLRVSIVSAYPLVRVETSVSTYSGTLTVDTDDGHYSGTIDVVVGAANETITITQSVPAGTDGSTCTVDIVYLAPPEFTALRFAGTYPGSQTEYKAGDTVQITGTTDTLCDAVEIMAPAGPYADGACQYQLITFAATTSVSVTATIADQGTSTVARPAYVRPRSAVGAFGAVRATNLGGGTTDHEHLVDCNNLYPSGSIGAITYPPTQGALKGAESATVANSAINFDTVFYDSPNGDLSIAAPTVFANPKTASRIGGVYNDSTNNFRVTYTRTANAASTTYQTIVEIAAVAPTITVTEPAARLRSGGNDGTSAQNHTITLTSNQKLTAAPTLNATPGAGTFLAAWAGGPKVWTRTLQVHDNDTKGMFGWLALSATNKANLTQTVITGDSNYTLGGFVSRNAYFPPALPNGTINVAVVTYTKLTASAWSLKDPVTHPPLRNPIQGDHSDIVDTYTVDSIGTNPTTVFCNDVVLVGQNTLGMYLEGLQETV